MELITASKRTTIVPSKGDKIWFISSHEETLGQWVNGTIVRVADQYAYLNRQPGDIGQWRFPLDGRELNVYYSYESFLEHIIQYQQEMLDQE